jgi:hypothetical protein
MFAALMLWQAPEDRAFATAVETVIEKKLGLGETKAAVMMLLNASQWTKQREGLGHPSGYRLSRLPGFWHEFSKFWLEQDGYVVLGKDELTAALLKVVALASGKRMATMGLRQEKKEKSA